MMKTHEVDGTLVGAKEREELTKLKAWPGFLTVEGHELTVEIMLAQMNAINDLCAERGRKLAS